MLGEGPSEQTKRTQQDPLDEQALPKKTKVIDAPELLALSPHLEDSKIRALLKTLVDSLDEPKDDEPNLAQRLLAGILMTVSSTTPIRFSAIRPEILDQVCLHSPLFLKRSAVDILRQQGDLILAQVGADAHRHDIHRFVVMSVRTTFRTKLFDLLTLDQKEASNRIKIDATLLGSLRLAQQRLDDAQTRPAPKSPKMHMALHRQVAIDITHVHAEASGKAEDATGPVAFAVYGNLDYVVALVRHDDAINIPDGLISRLSECALALVEAKSSTMFANSKALAQVKAQALAMRSITKHALAFAALTDGTRWSFFAASSDEHRRHIVYETRLFSAVREEGLIIAVLAELYLADDTLPACFTTRRDEEAA